MTLIVRKTLLRPYLFVLVCVCVAIDNDYNVMVPHSLFIIIIIIITQLPNEAPPAHHRLCSSYSHRIGLIWLLATETDRATEVKQPAQDTWLKEWQCQIADGPQLVQVPDSACALHAPLIHSTWPQALVRHPDQTLVQFLLSGITEGFRIPYSGLISRGEIFVDTVG